MSPDVFFGNLLFVFLNSPWYETPKNAIKKSQKSQKMKVRSYFFLRAGADVRRFLSFLMEGEECREAKSVLASNWVMGARAKG
jgi:hypothetical protein